MTAIDLKEFEQMASSYNLGKVLADPILEKGGLMNYNFNVETQQGTYMFRVKYGALSPFQLENKKLEYGITDHLHQNNFCYQTPLFQRNHHGNALTVMNDKNWEVYERLSGETKQHCSIKEVIEAVAKYHILNTRFRAIQALF